MNPWIIQIFVYFIIIQALFLALHFFTIKKPNLPGNKILGYLLVCFAISILSFRLIFDIPGMGFFLKKILYIVHLTLSFLMFILLFFYIQSIYKRKLKLGINGYLVHIIIFTLYLVFCQHVIHKIPSLLLENDLKLYATISSVKVSLYLIYLILIFLCLQKEYHSFSAFFSFEKNPNLSWLTVLTGSFILLWVMEFFVLLSILIGITNAVSHYIVIILTVVPFIFINAILIMALKKPLVFYVKQNTTSWSMKDDDQNKYLNGFIELMEKEKMYNDSELTLSKISELLKINPKYLSLILNKHLHSSFPDIVNKYRIETTKQLLKKNNNMTIQQIMYEVGYNSKSAFNKHFKRITGCTPSEYKEEPSK